MTPKDFDEYVKLMRKHNVLHACIDGTDITLGPVPKKLAPVKGKATTHDPEREEIEPKRDMAFAHTEGFPDDDEPT